MDNIKAVLYLSRSEWSIYYTLGYAIYNKDPKIMYYLSVSDHIGTAYFDFPDWSNIKL